MFRTNHMLPNPHVTNNPYELISSTLHNNEFSPASNLQDLFRINKYQRRPIINSEEFRVSNGDKNDYLNEYEPSRKTKASSHSQQLKPPPLPALECIPLSIKSINANCK